MDASSSHSSAEHKFSGDYDEAGVDLSLLRLTLGLSPVERLKRMEQAARDTRILNEYGRRQHQARPDPDR